jgi:hypothetical protein
MDLSASPANTRIWSQATQRATTNTMPSAGAAGYLLIDFGQGKFWYKLAGSYNDWNGNSSADPDAGTGGFDTGTGASVLYPYFRTGNAGASVSYDGADISGAGLGTFAPWDYPSGGTTLAAGNGIYVLGGNAGSLLDRRLLSAARGAFAFSGQAATLAFRHVLAAGQGAFGRSGIAAGLKMARSVAATLANFVFAGGAAALSRQPANGGNTLGGAVGALALSGRSAGLWAGRAIIAGKGGYARTGNAAALRRGRVPLPAGAGAFGLAGNSLTFRRPPHLRAMPGVFAVSGGRARFSGWFSASPRAAPWIGESAVATEWSRAPMSAATWTARSEAL